MRFNRRWHAPTWGAVVLVVAVLVVGMAGAAGAADDEGTGPSEADPWAVPGMLSPDQLRVQSMLTRIVGEVEAHVDDPNFAAVAMDVDAREVQVFRVGGDSEESRELYTRHIPSDVSLDIRPALLTAVEAEALNASFTAHFKRMWAVGIHVTGFGVHELGGRFVLGYDGDKSVVQPTPRILAQHGLWPDGFQLSDDRIEILSETPPIPMA